MRRVFVLSLVASLLPAFPAEAHDRSWLYTWAPEYQGNIPITWASQGWQDGRAMGATGRQRIAEAAATWNALSSPGVNFTFPDPPVYDLSGTASAEPCANPRNFNPVFYHWYAAPNVTHDALSIAAPQATIARARRCRAFSDLNDTEPNIVSFTMEVNSKYAPFYKGTSDAPPGTTYSLLGVATHEFGHASGFRGHWDTGPEGTIAHPGSNADSSLCPDDTTDHTMCARANGKGAYLRSLEAHDEHTFRAAYP